jgi:hypothetical protein
MYEKGLLTGKFSAKIDQIGGKTNAQSASVDEMSPPYSTCMPFCIAIINLHPPPPVVNTKDYSSGGEKYEGHLQSSWTHLLLRVGTLWRCGDGLFLEVPPLASDALRTTLHPLLENLLHTVYHFEISCLWLHFHGWKGPKIAWGEIWTVWRIF